MKLTLAEEKKMATNPRHRTTATILRKLASGYMLFGDSEAQAREWDRFEVRNIGLAVQRSMAREFHSDPDRIRTASLEFVRRNLRIPAKLENKLVSDIAVVLAMNTDLSGWSAEEKSSGAKIVMAKSTSDEVQYLKQMQKHASLRAFFINLGSKKRG
jgi:hypothetical protein